MTGRCDPWQEGLGAGRSVARRAKVVPNRVIGYDVHEGVQEVFGNMNSHSTGPEGSPQGLSQQLVNELVEVLIREGRVQIHNFGVFELKTHKARKGRNPRTGERITIPKKLRVTFRASRVLQGRLSEELARMEKASAEEAHGTTGSEMPKKNWWPFW